MLATVLLLSGSQIGLGQGADPGFGGPADVAFALRLWEQLQEARLVGANAIGSRPYEAFEPHGAILTTLQSTLAIDDREGTIIVKNNYLGENVSVQSVADNPRPQPGRDHGYVSAGSRL